MRGRLGTGFSTRSRLILLWMSLRVYIVASVVIAIITLVCLFVCLFVILLFVYYYFVFLLVGLSFIGSAVFFFCV